MPERRVKRGFLGVSVGYAFALSRRLRAEMHALTGLGPGLEGTTDTTWGRASGGLKKKMQMEPENGNFLSRSGGGHAWRAIPSSRPP
jgi:hypothetical protein